jgi:hypothetical protein
MLLSVADYATPKDAIADAVDGDAVYFGALGSDYTAPSGGWQIDKAITLYGDASGASIIRAYDRSSPVFVIAAPATNVHIRDLQLLPGLAPGADGAAVVCLATASGGSRLQFRRLVVNGFAGHGVRLEGYTASSGVIDGVTVEDCSFVGCGGAGIYLKNASSVRIARSTFATNQMQGLVADSCGVSLYDCDFDGNAVALAGQYEGNAKFKNCRLAKIEGCRFTHFVAGAAPNACVIDGGLALIGSNHFDTLASTKSGSAIVVTRTDTGQPLAGPIMILPNRFTKTATLVSVDANVVDCILCSQYNDAASDADTGVISLPQATSGLTALPTITRTSPAAHVVSGLVIPSTTAEPTSSPSGMMHYNPQSNTLRVFLGSWKTITTA